MGSNLITQKNKWMLLCTVGLLVLLSSCKILDSKANDEEHQTEISEIIGKVEVKIYTDTVSKFKKISMSDCFKKLKNSGFISESYIYFGRKTCPVCRNFVLKMEGHITSIENLYYVNTENLTEKEKRYIEELTIESVPYILKIGSEGSYKQISIDQFLDEKGDE